jgi:rhodanese-related sulfurtransferase/rubrerythrin
MFEKLRQLIEPVESVSADAAADFLAKEKEGSFTLIDVRQPTEYERGHIPGATLIPVAQLADSVDKLDREKPVVVYCAIGGRSRVAAHLLAGKGFKTVFNVKGGIMAWHGRVADGPAELHLGLVRGNETPEEVITLAYGMELGLAAFYRAMSREGTDAEVAALLEKLASIEDKHKHYLLDLYRSVLETEPDVTALESAANSRILEGGFDAATLMQENEHVLQNVTGLLELAMMLETQALDLYLRFAGNIEIEAARKILFAIADEEKAHLAALGKLLEDKIV